MFFNYNTPVIIPDCIHVSILVVKYTISVIPQYPTNKVTAGCDEAGRGCLAGPVVAAAVILPKDFYHENLNDSKKIKPTIRDQLRAFIEEHAVDYAVSFVDEKTIDQINILNATMQAMEQAISALKNSPEFLLIDGNRFYGHGSTPYKCIIKGDSTYASIAAASVLAKTYRDEYMIKLHDAYPEYLWCKNKGYGTKSHIETIRRLGRTRHHRKSFVIRSQGTLF